MVDPFAIPIDHQDVATGDFILDQRFLELPDGIGLACGVTGRWHSDENQTGNEDCSELVHSW